jgi:hypothetical protein
VEPRACHFLLEAALAASVVSGGPFELGLEVLNELLALIVVVAQFLEEI